MQIIYTTFPELDEAKKVAKLLIEKKLAACINILPQMFSVYSWENEICQEQEVVLIAKSSKEQFEAISQTIKANHSYDTPAIFSFNIDQVEENYLAWLNKQ